MRLHSRSIPLRAVVSTNLTEVATMVVVGVFGDGVGNPVGMVLGGLVAIAVLVCMRVAIEVVRYVHFEYDLTDDSLDIDSGVFSRREREIPLGRVQTLDITQGPLARLVGLAALDVETAGGGETEASLRYVSDDEARRLQDEIRHLKRDKTTASANDEGTAVTTPATETTTSDTGTASDVKSEDTASESDAITDLGEVLFELSTRELLLLSAIRLNLRPLVPIVVTVIGVAQVLPGRLAGFVASNVGPGALVIALATLAAGPVATVARYYEFRLLRVGDELRYERGLFNRYTGSVPVEKIQALLVRENPIERRLGYAGLDIVTAGYSAREATTGGNAAIPLADRETLIAFARSIDGFRFDVPEFSRPPKRARRRYVGRYVLFALCLSGVVFAANALAGASVALAGVEVVVPRVAGLSYWYAPLSLVALAPIAAHCKWRNLGYALGEEHVLTRGGFWSRGTEIVPYYRMQTVIDARSLLQRRLDLATVTIGTAGSPLVSLAAGGARAIDIAADDATALRETVRDRFGVCLREKRVATPEAPS